MYNNTMFKSAEEALERLSYSKFRAKFHLSQKDLEYARKKGIDTLRSHAQDFVKTRLADAFPLDDGKQTPTKNHPVFTAQHATATCCRNCLYRWHGIEKGRALSAAEQDYIVDIIMHWINREMNE